jgi:hypothetical protein
VLQAALQAAWAEILVETASSFHGLDSPSKAALIFLMTSLILEGSNLLQEQILGPTGDSSN